MPAFLAPGQSRPRQRLLDVHLKPGQIRLLFQPVDAILHDAILPVTILHDTTRYDTPQQWKGAL
jgi:hypothetical protein